ncbi:MAG: YkvA family protein [Lysobacteraceae bacterium]
MKAAVRSADNDNLQSDTIELRLEGAELEPFRQAWAAHRDSGSRSTLCSQTLLDSAHCFATVDLDRLPPFVRQRLDAIPQLIALIGDRDWRLGDDARTDLLAALHYFVDPDDLIPDQQPRYGLLDDALVIDIAIRARHHEWLAWHEFDRFRRELRARGDFRPLDREQWLAARRELLETGMRRRPTLRYDDGLSADRFHRERHSYVNGQDGDAPFGIH